MFNNVKTKTKKEQKRNKKGIKKKRKKEWHPRNLHFLSFVS